MARYVDVASVQFATNARMGARNAGRTVLAETRKKLESLRGLGLDLIVLSEGIGYFGLTRDTAERVERPGPFLELYMDFARREGCHLVGSLKLREGRDVHNSVVFVAPGGKILGAYHKSNLTAGERDEGMRCGSGAVVVDTAIGRLGGVICFDLNFEWLRKQYRERRPDILCFSSLYHGGLMQELWAYECRSFFVSSLQFSGCGVLDPFGRELRATDCYSNVARTRINLDRAMVHLDFNLEKFPAIERRYAGKVAIDIPPNIGSALLYGLDSQPTAAEVVREFKLEELDDYFARNLQENGRNRKRSARR